MDTPSDVDEYTTTDLPRAAFLVTLNVPLLAVRRQRGRALFVFPATARALASRYLISGQNLVPAHRFYQTFRELRQAIDDALGVERER